ncbi:hypothetical protein RD110_00160 [Rhodoferax koreense]|uniref:Cupin type-2 domain-containing protein n=1 Tax=Rhodoferax koreensis TaxID=1842727 RepID=A0A1P8JQ10_9BURK|nr:cupin domain-containing protein [Rhodoferax koreense]APW35823.1 hypothetical protein RD110_00160 [Rhodoferax koreense]
MKIRTSFAPVLFSALLTLAGVAAAHGAGEETVTPLQHELLRELPGKQAVMAVVAYQPGQASTPHQHGGTVMAYVLEGSVVSQVGDQPATTFHAGQSWVETPHAPHRVSRNASQTRPARLLVWLLMDEGGQVKQPLAE